MIGRADDPRPRSYSGVNFDVLVVDDESMVTKMKYAHGNEVPAHDHPNIQSGYVLSGRYRLRIDDLDAEIGPGDSYSIPAGVRHSVVVLTPGEIIDVFVPPRTEYI